MSKVSFKVQPAETGSHCRGCRKIIESPAVEVAIESNLESEDQITAKRIEKNLGPVQVKVISKYHPTGACLCDFRSTSSWWAETGPQSLEEFQDSELLGEEQRDSLSLVLDALRTNCEQFNKTRHSFKRSGNSSGDSGSDNEASPGESSPAKKRQRVKKETNGDDSEEEKPKKRRSSTPAKSPTADYAAANIPEEQIQAIKDVYTSLLKKTLVQLKAMCKVNNQKISGVKEELLARVAEGKVLGALPKCPECEKGTLKWNIESGEYECPGWFDSHMHKCPFKTSEIERMPWKDEDD